jgi:hypothetical protein
MDIRDLLDQDVPLRLEIAPDWEDVVRRANPTTRRRYAAGLGIAAALAASAFAAVALWPAHEGGVLERALAAVGTAPLVHVVYRDEAHETLVDLATGGRTPIYQEHEEWYAADNGLRDVTTFNGHVVETFVQTAGALGSQQRQTYAGILDGYRQALADGTARLSGSGAIAGHDVYWIHFKGEQLYDVGDARYHDWSHEVAVDRTTLRPVYVRQTRDGVPGPGTGQEILSLDTLPAGTVDFSKPEQPKPRAIVMGAIDAVDVTSNLGAATAELAGTPLWLGASYNGLPLAFAQTETLVGGAVGGSPDRTRGFEVCYGRKLEPHVPSSNRMFCDSKQRYVDVQESNAPTLAYDWDRNPAPVAIPPGSILIGWSGADGFLERDGVYLHVSAASEAELIAAVRALQPLHQTR